MSPEDPSESLARGLAPEDRPGSGDVAGLLALLNPPGDMGLGPLGAELPSAVGAPPAAQVVADLVERWVRRVALGGDQRRGVARLDIGQGRYAGAELLVSAEDGNVSVELTLAEAPSDGGLAERLKTRLEQRGFAAEVVVR